MTKSVSNNLVELFYLENPTVKNITEIIAKNEFTPSEFTLIYDTLKFQPFEYFKELFNMKDNLKENLVLGLVKEKDLREALFEKTGFLTTALVKLIDEKLPLKNLTDLKVNIENIPYLNELFTKKYVDNKIKSGEYLIKIDSFESLANIPIEEAYSYVQDINSVKFYENSVDVFNKKTIKKLLDNYKFYMELLSYFCDNYDTQGVSNYDLYEASQDIRKSLYLKHSREK